jgi:hypothetical protein
MRYRWFYLGLLVCLGCRSSSAERTNCCVAPTTVTAKPAALPVHSALPPIILEVRPSGESLDQAATCIERGDAASAVDHLNRHLKRFPEQIMIRAYLAELLLKMKKLPDAQDQFERFIAAAQEADPGAPGREHIVHCHTRLMEIAQEREDAYAEHLHRGIGMVLLARRLVEGAADDDDADVFCERLLCKAATELTKAAKARPDEPRPHWYLAEVWTMLEQPHAAAKAMHETRQRAALVPLPPAEHRALVLMEIPE